MAPVQPSISSSLYTTSEGEKDLEEGGGGSRNKLADIRRHSSQDVIRRPAMAVTTATADLEKTATAASMATMATMATITTGGGGGGGQQHLSVIDRLSRSLTPAGRSGAADRTTADFESVQGTPWEVRWADRDPENPHNWSLARRGWILWVVSMQTLVV